MILLQTIELRNFLSHSDTAIEFDPNENVLIDGKSGSGKSSIVEGLIWSLYGKGRSDNKSLIKKGTKKAVVTVTLLDDDKKTLYKIERSITGANKHKVEVTEADAGTDKFVPIKTTGVKGAQEYLEKEILHSSYALFVNSIAYPQDNIDSFVKQTAAKRKEIILEIINNAGYDEYLKRTKDELTTIRTDAKVNESRIEDKNSIIEDTKEKNRTVVRLQGHIAKLLKDIEYAEEEIKKVNTTKEELSIVLAQFDSKRKEQERLSSESTDALIHMERAQNEIDNIKLADVPEDKNDGKTGALKIIELKNLNYLKDNYLTWTIDKSKLIQSTPHDPGYDERINLINKQLIDVMDADLNACPKCGYKNAEIEEKHAKRVQSITNDLKDAQDGKNDLVEALFEHKEMLDALGEEPKYDENRISVLTDEIADAEARLKIIADNDVLNVKRTELEAKIKDLNQDYINNQAPLIKLKNELSKFESIENEVVSLANKIIALETQARNDMMEKEKISIDMAITKKEITAIEEAKKELKELVKAQKELDRNISSLELLRDALGPNGIKAIVIDYTIPQLEEKINDILSKLSDFRVRLDTQKSGLTKDTVLEGLFISIINDIGEELDFDNYSGGERLKIIVAISEALSEIQNIGFRILDELFVGLDEESIESFAKIMLILQQRFKQMFCISHLQSIKDLFDHRLMVNKVNGNSQVTK